MNGLECMAVLRALSEWNRLRIIRLLLNERLGCTTLSTRLEIPQYNVSKHLRILKEAGLLTVERIGKERLYSVVPALKAQLASNQNTLELGCCTFRFDQFPD